MSFFDAHFFNDATTDVLHGFAFGVDGDDCRGRYAFVQRGISGPQQEAAKANNQDPKTQADGFVGVGWEHGVGDIGDVSNIVGNERAADSALWAVFAG